MSLPDVSIVAPAAELEAEIRSTVAGLDLRNGDPLNMRLAANIIASCRSDAEHPRFSCDYQGSLGLALLRLGHTVRFRP